MVRTPLRLTSVDEARASLSRWVLSRARETVSLEEAPGAILAQTVNADRDLPPFDRAAVDGFAIALDGPWREGAEFDVVGAVPAGGRWRRRLAAGRAVRVMTGAPVPPGADGVVMVERSSMVGPDRVRLHGPFPHSGNRDGRRPGIAPRAEDAKKGEPVLARGSLLEANHVAVLASVGRCRVPVVRRPRVAVVTTGSEIVSPEVRPRAGQIRNGNGPMLQSLLSASGACRVQAAWAVPDRMAAIRGMVRRAMKLADVIVFTGGVSAGDYDFVPEALASEGFKVRLHGVALRPGKPFLFATRGPRSTMQVAFGLPGNPVSVLVTAVEFLVPYLRRCAGWSDPGPQAVAAGARAPVTRKPGLTHFVPAHLGRASDGSFEVLEIPWNGSGDFVAAGRADALIVLPAVDPRVDAGQTCEVHPLWFWPGTPVTSKRISP